MKKPTCVISWLLLIVFYLPIQAQTNWTLLIYADPCNDITEAVIKNITELASSYESNDITVYVQFRVFLNHDANRSYAWRYVIQNKSLTHIESVEIEEDQVANFTDAINWAFKENNSQYHGIIVTGHGSGILEPTYDPEYGTFELEYDDATIGLITPTRINRYTNRSILINELNGSAIDNDMMLQIMSHAFALLNKKIDLLGFDLSFGSCLEHAYQLAPYVHYFVGCQNCALIDGFDYYQIGKKLQQLCTPEEMAQHIITSYAKYYENISPQARYALSAINLNTIDEVTSSLDELSINLMNLMIDRPELIEEIIKIRKKSYHACLIPMYTDLYDFVEKIKIYFFPNLYEEEQQQLQPSISRLLQAINSAVCGNVHGAHLPNVHGINIYYPYSNIQTSYYTTQFAQNSNWLNFLMFMTDNFTH